MQRGRLLIVIAFIIVLGGVVVAFLLQPPPPVTTDGTPDPNATSEVDTNELVTPLPTADLIEIVIAVQPMPRGFRIPPNAVQLRQWPRDIAPFNAITNIEDVIGKIARTDIFVEQPILSNMIVDDLSGLANVGSDLAAVLPQGRVAVSLPIDRLTSVAYGIQPGDYVDVIMSMLFVNVDEAFQTLAPNCFTLFVITPEGIEFTDSICGRPDVVGGFNTLAIINASEAQRPRLVTQRTVAGAQVMFLGDFPPDGRFLGVPPTPTPDPEDAVETAEAEDPEARRQATAVPTEDIRPDIITLSVTPQDAVILTWAVEARLPLTFALRSASDISSIPTDEVTLDYILNEFSITLPASRSYTIEPAIRSIRQLFVGNEITLGSNATPVPASSGG